MLHTYAHVVSLSARGGLAAAPLQALIRECLLLRALTSPLWLDTPCCQTDTAHPSPSNSYNMIIIIITMVIVINIITRVSSLS